jgi:D-glycero-D-manno-heptose 1,7-bisphosphate phosphatase
LIELQTAIFFDRDGTLIEHVPYLSDPKHVQLLPATKKAIQLALENRCLLFLHTNQSAVGRGLCSIEEVQRCNEQMLDLLQLGDVFADVCVAPEVPDKPSKYRKPSPEFAIEKMRQMNLVPNQVFYIGDRVTDLLTAKAAGVRGIGVCTGLVDLKAELQSEGLGAEFPLCDDLLQAVSLALSLAHSK